jgi:hypothetical protein
LISEATFVTGPQRQNSQLLFLGSSRSQSVGHRFNGFVLLAKLFGVSCTWKDRQLSGAESANKFLANWPSLLKRSVAENHRHPANI